eukprot:14712803-Ditylum_brightwellii.AAC.1
MFDKESVPVLKSGHFGACGGNVLYCFVGINNARKFAIRAPLRLVSTVAKPHLEDVASQAKIMGYEHEKPPTNQGEPKSSRFNP